MRPEAENLIAHLARQPPDRDGLRRAADAAVASAALKREVHRLDFELRAARRAQTAGAPSEEVLALRHEIKSLRAKVSAFEGQVKPKPPADPNAEVTKLRARIRQLQAQLRAVIAAPKGAVHMAKAARRKILNCLHPDRRTSASEKQLMEVFQLFHALPIHELEL